MKNPWRGKRTCGTSINTTLKRHRIIKTLFPFSSLRREDDRKIKENRIRFISVSQELNSIQDVGVCVSPRPPKQGIIGNNTKATVVIMCTKR